MKIDHVETDNESRFAIVIFESRGIELQVHEHDVRRVHGYDLHACLVEFYTCIGQELLGRFDEGLERLGLDRTDLEDVG
jgi:hypothetical protein